jgi:hypothetical protein
MPYDPTLPDPPAGFSPPPADFHVGMLSDPDYGELVEDVTAAGAWSKREVSEPRSYDIAWVKQQAAMAFFLGIEYLGQDYLLHRTLPFPHPLYSYLFCTRVAQKQSVKFKARESGSLASGISSGGLPVPYSRYDRVQLSLEFSQPPYRVRGDAAVTGTVDIWNQSLSSTPTKNTVPARREWLRWCEVRPTPYADFNEAEGASFAYAEGATGNPKGNPLKGGIGISTSKMGVKVVWKQVPHNYIFERTDPLEPGAPWNLMAGANKVNAYDFMGFPAGTLLAEPPELDPYVSPVQVGPEPWPVYDVTFTWKFMDPPKGVRDSPAGTSPYRGWQLEQYWPDKKWYYATRTPLSGTPVGDPTSPPKFETYPFAYFFLPPYGQFLNLYTWATRQP